MNPNLRWLNVFFRYFLLALLLGIAHYLTHFNSNTVFLLTGMLAVLITWALSDYMNYKKWLSRTQ